MDPANGRFRRQSGRSRNEFFVRSLTSGGPISVQMGPLKAEGYWDYRVGLDKLAQGVPRRARVLDGRILA